MRGRFKRQPALICKRQNGEPCLTNTGLHAKSARLVNKKGERSKARLARKMRKEVRKMGGKKRRRENGKRLEGEKEGGEVHLKDRQRRIEIKWRENE